jgi:hypothetical protein
MTQGRADRMRENFLRQGGRPQRRTIPEPAELPLDRDGPGKRAEERILSIPLDEILPDRYQGRLRWPVELTEIERLYEGEWDAQDFLDYIAGRREAGENPALNEAWNASIDLARSILSEGQVAPITVTPARDLPVGYRYIIETGEGRFWAYQMMRWLLVHGPQQLDVELEEWREDPAFIRAVVITEASRLRQVAENEQRQSYTSAVDRAIAYASMLAEEAEYLVSGAPPGIRNGRLELPDAYWRAAKRGLRGRKAVLQQVPAGARQIQRHLKLLTDLDPLVLAQAKQHGLSEAQLRPLVGKPPEEQRRLVALIVEEGLSSREAAALSDDTLDEEPTVVGDEPLFELRSSSEGDALDTASLRKELTLPEEVSRLLRSLTTAAARYEALRKKATDNQILALLEGELRSYDEAARGSRRARTPRRRIQRLQTLLQELEEP